jgi:hypothetical protein
MAWDDDDKRASMSETLSETIATLSDGPAEVRHDLLSMYDAAPKSQIAARFVSELTALRAISSRTGSPARDLVAGLKTPGPCPD